MSGPYDSWRLPDLLAMVEADSDEATTAHLNAWQEKHELLSTQRKRLTELVTDLTAHWDPTKSEAAQGLVHALLDMISVIDSAAATAAKTRDSLGAVTTAISDARKQLRSLSAQYHDEAAAAHEFNRRTLPFLPDVLNADQPLIPLPGLDSMVLRQHQDRLDERARAVMSGADVYVNEAAIEFRGMPQIKRLNPGGVYDPVDQQSAASTHWHEGPTFNPPPPSVPSAGGTDTPPAGTVSPVLAGGPTSSPPNAAGPTPTLGSEPAPTLPAVVGTRPVSDWLSDTGGKKTAMRPGGVIGDDGINGGVRPRVGAPVSGVLGDRTPPAVPRFVAHAANGRSGETRRGVPSREAWSNSSAGGWRDRSYEQYVATCIGRGSVDPDDPWGVEQGVPPVLEAAPAPKDHDAGPGVIGIDR